MHLSEVLPQRGQLARATYVELPGGIDGGGCCACDRFGDLENAVRDLFAGQTANSLTPGGQRFPLKGSSEKPFRLVELAVRRVETKLHNLLTDPSCGSDRHCHDDRPAEMDQMESADYLVAESWSNYDRRIVADLRQQPTGLTKQLAQLFVKAGEECLDPLAGSVAELCRGTVIHVVPIAGRGRDPPCRRVRLSNKAVGLEFGEIVANGCAGYVDGAPFKHGARTDRLAGSDVLLNQGLKNDGSAVIEHQPNLALAR